MKEIKVFIRKSQLSRVVNELSKKGFCCTTITECEGTGSVADTTKDYPIRELTPFTRNKISKIEIVSKVEDVETIISVVQKSARTGEKGDGIIYISNVDELIRIRDNMRGKDIISVCL